MQRSIINKKYIDKILYFVLFLIYESLSSMYLFLPPLFSVLFVLYAKALKKDDLFSLILIVLALLAYEADKGYEAFSSILYFTIVAKFIMPKITQSFGCISCIKISYVVLAYIGFYFVSLFLSNIFLTTPPEFTFYIFYYIVIEFFFVSLI